MRAVALRLEGPLQSWGGPTAGDDRPTLDTPTKSGVLGLVAGALGIGRQETAELVALHRGLAFAVRVDKPGVRGVDFHTTEGVPRVSGGIRKDPVVSRRSYLYDASFLALLAEREGLSVPLDVIRHALRWPAFAPFLGRRACPTAEPVLACDTVLAGEGWLALFRQVPPCAGATSRDAYLEDPGDISFLRELRVRTTLAGPLPRLFSETRLYHLRLDPMVQSQTADDTVDPWFAQ